MPKINFQLEEQPYTEADAEWDEFVVQHPHGSILQTTNWARLKGRFGWKAHRVWMKQDGKLVAGAQVLYRTTFMGLVGIGYIPHGPLVDWQDEEQTGVLFNQIDQAAYDHHAGMVKIEPRLWQDEAPNWPEICQQYDLITDTDSIQPLQTILVDLRPSPDDILANMKSKTRYNIRLSARKEVTVRQGTEKDIPAFIKLMQTTGQRDAFSLHMPDYYRAVYEMLAPSGQLALFIAEYETRPLAAIMVSKSGDTASYLFGASGNEERQRMAPYAVQWAAMQWAKENGCAWYDLWGIPPRPLEELEANFTQRSSGLWGVYRHKRGYGGLIKRTVGPADRVYNNLVYKLYKRKRGAGNQ